jgi:hypothetical protein
VLGATNYTYAEATWTQSLPDWIGSHQRAVAFFGGVPALLVPDNLRAAVTKADRDRYAPEPNATYLELARHDGTAILPARPYKPKDKAKAEVGVQVLERWILARLRHRSFFSLAELNAAIAELLIALNERPFQKLPGSRRSLFELNAAQRHDLMELIEERHGRRATLIASQLPVDTWHELIGEATLADADPRSAATQRPSPRADRRVDAPQRRHHPVGTALPPGAERERLRRDGCWLYKQLLPGSSCQVPRTPPRPQNLTDRDCCIDTRRASAAASPKAVTIVGTGGHFRRNTHYYGITDNAQALSRLRFEVQRRWRKWLNRRSRATRLNWSAFNRLLKRYPLPPARVVHSIYAT